MNELTLAARTTNWGRLKALVLDSVSSPITKRVYNLGLDEFFQWFGREPRSGLNKATVRPWQAEHVDAGTERPIELANQLMGIGKAAAALLVLFLLGLFSFAAFGQSVNEQTREILDHAVADFQQGRIEQSVDGFDRVAKLVPTYAPQLWQRGIALYYAGRYQDCRAQFESHRTVNPDDVENAAWHFLCVARAESAEKARRALLPVGPDPRVPMREIYEMFRGKYTPEQVMRAAGEGEEAQFYAYLYTGLYYDALGDAEHALRQITEAAGGRFSAAGYMHGVARVHRDLLIRAKPRIP